MTRSDIIETIVEEFDLAKSKAKNIVESIFGQIETALANHDDVSINGFGKFTPHETKPRNGRNPRTGETVKIKASTVVKFKPATALKNRVAESTTKKKK
jgi:nucleoid DNA-binding protein